MPRKGTHTGLAVAAVTLAGVLMPAASEAQEAEDSRSARLSAAEIEALYRARQDSARMRFTEADVDFVTGMIAHHAQALVMSELAPARGASPSVQTLAARIINAQTDEIALMQRWLEDRGQPVPQVKIDGLELTIDTGAASGHALHGAHAHRMPGMLTREQLEELAASFGAQFDHLFLTFMIGHHQGAVTMVEDLFSVDGTGQDEAVFKLASDVQVDQITESERMRRMLDAMTDSDPASETIGSDADPEPEAGGPPQRKIDES